MHQRLEIHRTGEPTCSSSLTSASETNVGAMPFLFLDFTSDIHRGFNLDSFAFTVSLQIQDQRTLRISLENSMAIVTPKKRSGFGEVTALKPDKWMASCHHRRAV